MIEDYIETESKTYVFRTEQQAREWVRRVDPTSFSITMKQTKFGDCWGRECCATVATQYRLTANVFAADDTGCENVPVRKVLQPDSVGHAKAGPITSYYQVYYRGAWRHIMVSSNCNPYTHYQFQQLAVEIVKTKV